MLTLTIRSDERSRFARVLKGETLGYRCKLLIMLQLTNSGGTVSVIDATGGLLTRVTYPGSGNGEVLFFA